MTQPGDLPTAPTREPTNVPAPMPEQMPGAGDTPTIQDPPTNPDTPGLPGDDRPGLPDAPLGEPMPGMS
jgi:hypothetical protein